MEARVELSTGCAEVSTRETHVWPSLLWRMRLAGRSLCPYEHHHLAVACCCAVVRTGAVRRGQPRALQVEGLQDAQAFS